MTSGYHILNMDGGMVSSGRRSDDDPPGEAAIAVVLKKTKKGRKTEAVVESFGRPIGPRMNDEAEYEALLEGLRTAIKHGATHVRAFMDSEFVVEQINNGILPKEKDLVPLYKEARSRAVNAYKKNKERILAGETYRSRKAPDWKRKSKPKN